MGTTNRLAGTMGKVIPGTRVRLREKEIGDARRDYLWQMDEELSRLDACTVVTMSYQDFFVDYTAQLRSPNPSRRMFAVVTFDGRHIGNCSYYNINDLRRETELGIMIGDRAYWGQGYGQDAVRALLEYIFANTRLTQVHLKSLDWNLRAHRCFEKCGFRRSGYMYRDGYSFILMEVRRENWLQGDCEPARVAGTSGQTGKF